MLATPVSCRGDYEIVRTYIDLCTSGIFEFPFDWNDLDIWNDPLEMSRQGGGFILADGVNSEYVTTDISGFKLIWVH
ncbi:hypothetical protein SAJA_14050 [Salinisphaera japonica YTM-1]|uniref:Uncharacterized protein n=1 Tax=Salinisphaera japonica YTM-1 TaxID=1209778 RepID=A0A423PFU1_9GAMM|nr:hypothetical protein SAJA_14050 [Salinisphaera japonica YTM-1]